MIEFDEKKADMFRKRQRLQWAPPTIVNPDVTYIFSIEFLEDVELISLFVHPGLLEFFQINAVSVGKESIFDGRKDMKRFDHGGLRFPENPIVRVGTFVFLSITNKTKSPNMFLANFTALAQLKN